MGLRMSLYPKTKRIGNSSEDIIITEKLDGSNLGIFKVKDELIIAQRNWVFKRDQLTKQNAYKGLIGWLDEHGDELLSKLRNNSGFFGEWIGMGNIKYGDKLNNIKLHMFAKANLSDELEISNIHYDKSLFIYPFEDLIIPDFIGVVNTVSKTNLMPTIAELDGLFELYELEQGRECEGFIINNNNSITKYVRRKSGSLMDHKS